MNMSEHEIRTKYAGAIFLLCECSTEVEEDTRESIKMVISDWCKATGWKMTRTLDRIDVNPPQI